MTTAANTHPRPRRTARAPARAVVAGLGAATLFGGGCAGEIVSSEPDADETSDAAAHPDDDLECHDWLEAAGAEFSPAGATPGVDDPVEVFTPISGIGYRASWLEEPRDSLFMDCELARSLVVAAPYLQERDIVEVADMGVYNYRCIGGGTPGEDCPEDEASQHAYAMAIDIAGFTTSGGEFLSVEDDWIIDPDDVPTCEAEAQGDKNALLHELMCELKGDGVWNIVLTPNYNAAHRDHFHVDLTEGGDFIRSRPEHGWPAH